MPQYWLLKTEPNDYAYADLERDGKTVWDGVTNNWALKNMRSMQPGDCALIYHTGKEKAIVGMVKIITAPYPDPAQDDPKRVVVDIAPARRFARPLPLAEIKAEPAFAEFGLVRFSRLSVIPVPEDMWKKLLHMAGEK